MKKSNKENEDMKNTENSKNLEQAEFEINRQEQRYTIKNRTSLISASDINVLHKRLLNVPLCRLLFLYSGLELESSNKNKSIFELVLDEDSMNELIEKSSKYILYILAQNFSITNEKEIFPINDFSSAQEKKIIFKQSISQSRNLQVSCSFCIYFWKFDIYK